MSRIEDERKRLTADFMQYVSEHNLLQSLEVQSVLRGEQFTLSGEMEAARSKREFSKAALLAFFQRTGA